MSDKKYELKKAFKLALTSTTPVLAGFLVLGFAYGLLMQSKGYGVIWIFLMSAFGYCGSMQFAAIPLLVSTYNPLHAFLLSITVNARHLFYGLSLIDKYRGMGKIKWLLVFMLSDETYTVNSGVVVPDNIDKKYFYTFTSVLGYLYWLFSTLLGGILGQFLPDFKGFDFVLTALFVVMFLNKWEDSSNRIPGLIGIVCTALCRIIFGSKYFIIAAMVLISISLIATRKKLEEKEESKCI